MTIYWTLQIPGHPTEVGFGSPIEFIHWLNQKNLPHNAGPDWITDLLGHENPNGTTGFVQQYHGKPVWTLTWGQPQPGVHENTV